MINLHKQPRAGIPGGQSRQPRLLFNLALVRPQLKLSLERKEILMVFPMDVRQGT